MDINRIPIELFVNILEYIPIRMAMNVMLVNRKWYREYQGILVRQKLLRPLIRSYAKGKECEQESRVIDKLLKHYEDDPYFEGWFPDWLWEKRAKNRNKSHYYQILLHATPLEAIKMI